MGDAEWVIMKHIPEIKIGTLHLEVFPLIADKLEEYKKQIEEKDKIIARLLGEEK